MLCWPSTNRAATVVMPLRNRSPPGSCKSAPAAAPRQPSSAGAQSLRAGAADGVSASLCGWYRRVPACAQQPALWVNTHCAQCIALTVVGRAPPHRNVLLDEPAVLRAAARGVALRQAAGRKGCGQQARQSWDAVRQTLHVAEDLRDTLLNCPAPRTLLNGSGAQRLPPPPREVPAP